MASKDFKSHILDLQAVFTQLHLFGFTLHPKKCDFAKSEVNFLGFKINQHGIAPDPEKVKVMTEFPEPKNIGELKRAMGLLNFYRRFIPSFSRLAAPLYSALKKGAKFKWTPEMSESLKSIREALLQNAVLHHPDLNKPFIITTDASKDCISHTVSQYDESHTLRPISFFSQHLSRAQIKWHINEKETFSLVMAFRKNRHLFGNSKILCFTDNLTTRYIQQLKHSSNPKIVRWALELQRYPFEILHRPGSQLKVADCLSRLQEHHPHKDKEILVPHDFDDDDEGILAALPDLFDHKTEIPTHTWLTDILQTIHAVAPGNIYVPRKPIKPHKSTTVRNQCDKNKQTVAKPDDTTTLAFVTSQHRVSPVEYMLCGQQGVPQHNANTATVTLSYLQQEGDNLHSNGHTSSTHHTHLQHNYIHAIQDTHTPMQTQSRTYSPPPYTLTYSTQFSDIPLFIPDLTTQTPHTAPHSHNNALAPQSGSSGSDTNANADSVQQQTPHSAPHSHNNALAPQSGSAVSDTNTNTDSDQLGYTEPHNITPEQFVFQEEQRLMDACFEHRMELADEQRADPYFSKIYAYLLNGTLPSSQRQARALLADIDNWVLDEEGMLRRIYKPPRSKQASDIIYQLAIPPRFRRDIIETYHDSLMGGHQGAPRLTAMIREKFYWPKLYSEVYQYVKSCDACQKAKRNMAAQRAPLQLREVPSFLGRIHMDCLHLPKSKEGFTVLLAVIDAFSKAVELIPCIDETAATLARQFFRHWVCRYSVPVQITTDKHPSFMSNFMKELAVYLGMEKLAISTSNPKSNGQVERVNSQILNTIRALSTQFPLSWPDMLPSVRFSFMTAPCNSTQFSPYELLHGVPPRFPQAYMWSDPAQVPPNTLQNMQMLLPELAMFRQAAKDNLLAAAELHKQQYDRRVAAQSDELEVGDLVLLKDYREPGRSTDKFSLKFWGPFRVTRKFGPVLYELLNLHTYDWYPSLVHFDRLRLYNPPDSAAIRKLPRETLEELGLVTPLPTCSQSQTQSQPATQTPLPQTGSSQTTVIYTPPMAIPPSPTPQPPLKITTNFTDGQTIQLTPHLVKQTLPVTRILRTRKMGSRTQYRCRIKNQKQEKWLYEEKIPPPILETFKKTHT